MDFTLIAYKQLISTLQSQGYFFQTFEEYIKNPKVKVVILRHDVDRLPKNALVIAKIEKGAGIKSSYYFRIVKESYDEGIIMQIADLGHEIGYHYEDLALAKGNYDLAIANFESNLEKFRKIYPVKTICMHGSPLSKYDNKKIWEKYDYRDYGIIAEPYFDINFNDVFYLTDTGRRWDGSSVSVRDKVSGQLTKRRDGILSPGMNRMNRMIPAGWDGKNKRDEWMEPLGRMNRTIRMDGWMNGFARDGWMNRMETLRFWDEWTEVGSQGAVSFTKLHIHSVPGLSYLLLSRCFGLLPIAQ